MGRFLDIQSLVVTRLYLMPCNGTKCIVGPHQLATEGFELIHEASMKEHLGEKKYEILMQELIYSQVDMCHEGVPFDWAFYKLSRLYYKLVSYR